jgi:hypothetical protein
MFSIDRDQPRNSVEATWQRLLKDTVPWMPSTISMRIG